MANTDPAPRIPALDGLRAISILLVVWGHGIGSTATPFFPSWISVSIGNGSLGVQIFFVLSGFLITGILLKEKARTQKIDLPRFYQRRFFRIVPASYFYLLTIAALSALGYLAVSWSYLTPAFLYILNYQALWDPQGEGYWYVGHFWTLCMEQQFYLLWPFVLSRLANWKAAKLLGAVLLLLPLVRLGSYFLFPSTRGQLGMMFHTGADSIFIGSLTAILATERPEFAKSIARLAWPWAFVGGTFLFFGSPILRPIWGNPGHLLFGGPLFGALAAFLILWSIGNTNSLFTRAMNVRPLAYIGAISYSLYLWQQLFTEHEHGERPMAMRFLLVACAFAAAAISYHLFENPIIRWGRKRFSSRE